MLSRPLMIGHVAVVEPVAGLREAVRAGEAAPVKLRDLTGGKCAEILGVRIRPEVLARARDEQLAGRDQGEQPVLRMMSFSV